MRSDLSHPYCVLLTLCKKESEDPTTSIEEGEAGEEGSGTGGVMSTHAGGAGHLGVNVDTDEGPRYFGYRESKLELSTGALQTAWCVFALFFR